MAVLALQVEAVYIYGDTESRCPAFTGTLGITTGAVGTWGWEDGAWVHVGETMDHWQCLDAVLAVLELEIRWQREGSDSL